MLSAWKCCKRRSSQNGLPRFVIAGRIARFELGLLGDVKSVGDGVLEARVDFGPGYRLYFVRRGDRLIVLLVGGDKSSQPRDIARAKDMAARID